MELVSQKPVMCDRSDRKVVYKVWMLWSMHALVMKRPDGPKVQVFESKDTAPPERKTVTLTRGVQLSVGP